VFAGRRTIAELLGCWMDHVEKHIGPCDAKVRIGTREDSIWLLVRVDRMLKFADRAPPIFYARREAVRRCGITTRVGQRLLNSPVAFLESGYGHKLLPLFCARQLDEIREGIRTGEIRIQTRSLRSPKKSAYTSSARHVCANDLRTERERINRLQSEPKFWANLL
jgi:hypothetical protein